MCNRSSFASTRQPAEFVTGHALQIACRERGAVGICERGYTTQKAPMFEYPNANHVRGDAPFIAQRSGGLTQLFCSQKFPKTRKDDEALARFLEGADFSRKQRERIIHPFDRLSASFTFAYTADFDGDIVF